LLNMRPSAMTTLIGAAMIGIASADFQIYVSTAHIELLQR
jgi:hypothetical protein